MRTDEQGNRCPETLGEYRALCVALSPHGEQCAAVALLDEHAGRSSDGLEAEVIAPDSQMRMLLMPRLLQPADSPDLLVSSMRRVDAVPARYSPTTRRRLRTGADAMEVPTDGKTIREVTAQMHRIADGIRALQSLDDLGPDMNKRAVDQERELLRRYEILEEKLNELRAQGKVA